MKKIFLLTASFILSACSSSQWETTEIPDEASVYAMLQTQGLSEKANLFLNQKDQIELPKSVRPCCAFGNEQSVELGNVQVPLFHLPNTVDKDTIGPHIYGAGQFNSRRAVGKKLPQIENNGVMYTVRGGFIDMAHVRDTADNTIGLYYMIYPQLGKKFTLELSPELGARKIEFDAVDLSQLDNDMRRQMAIKLAAFYAFKMAEGHEVSQWHGYESFPLFSELVSAYSIEDLYSNMLGAKLAAKLLTDNLATSFDDYNKNMTIWIHSALDVLGAYEASQTATIFKLIDGAWWDSATPIPNKYMVLRRNYNLTQAQTPALIKLDELPFEKAADLRPLIQPNATPQKLALTDESSGIRFSSMSKMTMEIQPKYKASFKHIPAHLYENDIIDAANYSKIASYDEIFDQDEYQQILNQKD